MLVKMYSYPPKVDEMEYFLGFHTNCECSARQRSWQTSRPRKN
jgi:hypothetical protein